MTMTTVGDRASAAELARAAVEERLAGCVQVLSVGSTYRWEGAIETADEQLLLIKTTALRAGELEAFLSAHHPYEEPEILTVPIVSGSEGYLTWLAQSTD